MQVMTKISKICISWNNDLILTGVRLFLGLVMRVVDFYLPSKLI